MPDTIARGAKLVWRRPTHDPGLFVAYLGAFPAQKRYEVRKSGSEWRVSIACHCAGRGWIEYMGLYTRTAKTGREVCEEWANPKPINRNSSSYTDA